MRRQKDSTSRPAQPQVRGVQTAPPANFRTFFSQKEDCGQRSPLSSTSSPWPPTITSEGPVPGGGSWGHSEDLGCTLMALRQMKGSGVQLPLDPDGQVTGERCSWAQFH